ncbi:MAG: YdbH domain-containing protein [Rhodospirillaceae bacterium]|nr:YdbH domain-containing protein [Rhodospirillaceae bacterium]
MAVAGVISWSQRLAIAEFAIERAAGAAGLADLSLRVDRLDLDRATVTDVTIGGDGGQRIARLEARYSLGGLWRGTVSQLAITGLSLRGSIGDGGLVLPGLPAQKASKSGDTSKIPVQIIQFEEARITLETPKGTITVSTDGTVDTPDGASSDIEAAFAVESAFGRLKGRTTASRLGSGEVFGQIVLHDGNVAAQPVAASGLHGTVQVISLSGEAVDVDANLDARQLNVAEERLGATRLAVGARVTDSSNAAWEVNLQNRHGSIDLAGTASQSDADGIAAAATYAVDITRAALTAKASGKTRIDIAPNGRITGDFRIEDGMLAQDGSQLSGITGQTKLSRDRDGKLQGTANLAFESIAAHGFQSEPGTISATLDDQRAAIKAALRWAGGALLVNADGPADGAVRFETEGQVTDFQPVSRLLEDFSATGRTAFQIAGILDMPGGVLAATAAAPLDLLRHIEAKGWIDSDVRKVDVPDLARDTALKGRIHLTNGAEGLQLTTPNLHATVGSLAGALTAQLPDNIRSHLTGPLTLNLRPYGGENAVISVAPHTNGQKLSAAFAARLKAKDADISVRTKGQALVGPNGALTSIAAPRSNIDLRVREPGRGDLTGRLMIGDLLFEDGQLKTRFDLKASLDGIVDDALPPLSATAGFSGRASLNAGILASSLNRGGSLSVKDIAVPDKFMIAEPVTLKLAKPARVRIDTGKGLPSLTYSAAAVLSETTTRIKAGDKWLDTSQSAIPVTAKTKDGNHAISLQVASLQVPDHKLQVSGVTLGLTVGKELRVTVDADTIEHRGKPAFVTPLRFTGSLTGSGPKMTFDGRIFDAAERISITLNGRHDRETKRGALSVDTQKLVFLPTVLQPVQLFPILGTTMREVDGEVDMLANFAWDDGAVTSDMELLVDAKLIKADEFSFENAAAVVRFDSLLPPSTPPKQEVNIGLLDVGVPMLNGRLEFQLNKDGSVLAALRELDFFGGRIETDQFIIPENYDGFTVPLQVNGVELDNLLALAKSGDLTATGTLNGSIPVAIDSGEVAIRDGVLESAPGGGSIRYRPTAVGPSLSKANEGMELFLQIVDDFQYDKVKVTLNEDIDNEVEFRFKIEGRNKEVYKGIPVELNIAMDGPLRKILTQGLKTYQLPERILTGMKRFEDKP